MEIVRSTKTWNLCYYKRACIILNHYEYSKTNRHSRNYQRSFVSHSVSCAHGIIIENVLPPCPYVKKAKWPVMTVRFIATSSRLTRYDDSSRWIDGCPAQEMETSLITVIPISRRVIGRHHERRIRITTCVGQLTYWTLITLRIHIWVGGGIEASTEIGG